MNKYYIKTDAESMEIETDSFDAAAREFSGTDAINAMEFLETAAEIDDAWAWIERDDGYRIGGSTPAALAEWLCAEVAKSVTIVNDFLSLPLSTNPKAAWLDTRNADHFGNPWHYLRVNSFDAPLRVRVRLRANETIWENGVIAEVGVDLQTVVMEGDK